MENTIGAFHLESEKVGFGTLHSNDKEDKKMKCCICGSDINGYGNNASPVRDGICCDSCNNFIVLPVRIAYKKIEKLSITSGTPIQTIINNITNSRLASLKSTSEVV